MFEYVSIAVGVVYLLSVLILVSLCSLFLIKFRHARWDKKQRAVLEKYRDYLADIKERLRAEGDLPLPSETLKKIEQRCLQVELLSWMEGLSGKQLDKLVGLCDRMGLVQRDLSRLRSRLPMKRIDAVYNLGVMRAEAAVPSFLRLLKKTKDDASLFIIAHAIFNTSQKINIIRETIVHILQKSPSAHSILVEMLRVSPVNLNQLYTDLVHASDPVLVKMGLMGLDGRMDLDIETTVTQLLRVEEKDIRIEAAGLLLQSAELITPTRLARFISHSDWEIRFLTAETIGRLELTEHMNFLKQAMADPVWQVRYTSASSLALLGTEGFRELCEIAATSKQEGTVETAHRVITETLQRYGYNQQNKENLRKYYGCLRIYEQFFGESPHYHQAM